MPNPVTLYVKVGYVGLSAEGMATREVSVDDYAISNLNELAREAAQDLLKNLGNCTHDH